LLLTCVTPCFSYGVEELEKRDIKTTKGTIELPIKLSADDFGVLADLGCIKCTGIDNIQMIGG
jgi:hypothetical protein